jgi:hypothetical protein
MPFCSACGTKCADDAKFCSACGKALLAASAAEQPSQPTDNVAPVIQVIAPAAPLKAFDNDSVGTALNHLSLDRKKSIMYLDKMYQLIGKTTVVMFVSNTILSGIVIYNYYLDNQTTSTYITNILFMSTKIYDVYSNSTSDENIFYSAYLKTKVQYNDVDPSKFIEFTCIDEDIEKSEHNESITQPVEIENNEDTETVEEIVAIIQNENIEENTELSNE